MGEGRPQLHLQIREAVALHEAGRHGDAERLYLRLLDAAPGNGALWHNLGVLRAGLGDHASAVDCFDRAIACDATYASAFFNRAGALKSLGRLEKARTSYTRAVLLEPELYEGHLALGFLWLEAGARERALDYFAHTLELRRGDDRIGIAEDSLRHATVDKLRHDAAQFRYLARLGRARRPFELHARAYDEVASELGEGVVELSEEQFGTLSGIYNTSWYMVDTPEVAGSAVNAELDTAAIEAGFGRDGAVWFDGLLSSSAIDRLYGFLLGSTIWSDFTHIDGFLAAYLEDGLACPLVLQIADEVRHAFPAVIRGQPLTQAWAFKALHPARPIGLHSDDGAVSLNFWITPDSANKDPAGGGMVLHESTHLPGWYGDDLESETAAPRKARVVPYRRNRAVLFESRLLHGSDAPDFKEGYENRRINMTLVYGQARP